MARSTFYYNLKVLNKPDRYAEIKSQIRAIFDENKGRYGYRRIALELRNRGFEVNHKTVLKLMNLCGLRCKIRARKLRSFKGRTGQAAPNILKRNFDTEVPNRKWATDVTEFNICGAKIFLSSMLDMFNGEIVSYNISNRQTFKQTVDTLEKALAKVPGHTDLMIHSDQGWQYRMRQYQQKLITEGILQSMSRKGNCIDNAAMESFFGILKSELLYSQSFYSVAQFKKELVEYIDYYNNRRIKVKLNGMSPVQYRAQYQKNNY